MWWLWGRAAHKDAGLLQLTLASGSESNCFALKAFSSNESIQQ